ncbi:kinesin-like protein KIF20B isoform X2 [Aplysia californica]|uniref:Kinesin-like protein KIF20B isoform X2 n=1 Tax=Aplysia californica TaxID=6500 RepID=A0ABM0JF11_APLCA|nr:kinesin-like protein KIF20B isoform X2 [Aplysia californica]
MDSARGSNCGKRSFMELQTTGRRKPDSTEDEGILPVKKKLKTKLVDLFNRASLCLMNPEDRMNVYLRVKPFTKDEDSSQQCLEVEPDGQAVVATAPATSHSYKSMKRGLTKASHRFTFSKIFGADTSQKEFFNETMLGMTKDFISGQNSLVFSYGVTSSGKTYTIQGNPEDAGILPRCLDVIFNSINGKQMLDSTLKPCMFTDVIRLSPEEVQAEKKMKQKTLRMSVDDDTTVMALLGDDMESVLSDTTTSSTGTPEDPLLDVENREREELKVDVEDQGKIRFSVWVSFAEIYNEQVFDLLEPMPRKKNARRQVLRVSDDRNGNPYIKGLKEIHVESADEAYRLLIIGQRNLQTASTRLNHCSSRSHCIFNIKIVRVADKDDPHIARVSMLSLCDLAGSERYSKTQASGDRLKEAGNINTSLMTLGRCIETLRQNQMHKDQHTQKMVPFRDSKLTRLLQNFFNGSGRAAMIVNVSQCLSMFDDTLHVFKFSAIAKQVKHIEKPPKPPKPTKKAALQTAQRASIAWETKEMLEYDHDLEDDIVEEDESEACDDGDDSEPQMTLPQMKSYIKKLEANNKRLGQIVMEEIENSSNVESRVREEVSKAMMQQVVEIEETYSALLKESSEESQEISDERVRAVMEVYEKRLERIQRKVDEDDEWVSSLLLHQEEMKVKERDEKIADLEKQIDELKTCKEEDAKQGVNDSVDIGNSVLVETLTKRLEDASEACKDKDGKIEELESLLTEAGEVYNRHMEEIAELKKTLGKEKKREAEQEKNSGALKEQLEETKAKCDSLAQTLTEKEDLTLAQEEEISQRLKSKDATIASLEEECKELQGEIERLQDQMSQIDEQSRHNLEISSSSGRMSKESAKSDAPGQSETGEEQGENEEKMKCDEAESAEGEKEASESQNCLSAESMKTEMDALRLQITEYEESDKALKTELDKLKELTEEHKGQTEEYKSQLEESKNEVDRCKELENKLKGELQNIRYQVSEQEQKENRLNSEIEELKAKVEVLCEREKELGLEAEKLRDLSSEIESLKDLLSHSEKKEQELNAEIEKLQEQLLEQNKANEDLSGTVQALGNQISTMEKKRPYSSPSKTCITDIVNQIEQKNTPEIKKEVDSMIQDDEDEEIVFRSKPEPMTQTGLEQENTDLAVKLKETEMANAALRSKLKREEEDFFKREQALIHGYTAEIENLKLDLAKYKCKVETVGKSKSFRGKRKATTAVDVSVSSAFSDSLCVDSENEGTNVASVKANSSDGGSDDRLKIALISEELSTVQQQFLSLSCAYKQLQVLSANKKARLSIASIKGQSNQTNSFIQDVILGNPKKGLNQTSIFAPEENVTDSVLTFENEEFAIKLEEVMLKLSQQEQELRNSEEALKIEKKAREDAENKLTQIDNSKEQSGREHQDMVIQLKETLELTLANKNELETQVKATEEKLQTLTEQMAVGQEALKTATEERDHLKASVERLKQEILSIEEQKNQSQEVMNSAEEKMGALSREIDNLEVKVTSVTDQLAEAQEQCSRKCQENEVILKEKGELQSKLEADSKDLASCRERLQELELKHTNDSAAVQKIMSEKDELQKQLTHKEEQLSSREKELETKEAQFASELNDLKQHANKEESMAEAMTSLEEELANFKTMLQNKVKQLEEVEERQQEEAAEFSQKLLALEKEKKAAERKLTEAKEREEELETKCRELDRLNQLEQRLYEEHKMSADKEKRQEDKVEEMKAELAKKNAELEQLWNDINQKKELQRNFSDLEKNLAHEKESHKEAQNTIEKMVKDLKTLKAEMFDSEETMSQQESIIQTQDDELRRLQSEKDAGKAELERLSQTVHQKGEEISRLQSQISKLEGEVSSMHQIENETKKSEEREKMFHEKLQKSNSEKSELESKVDRLEKEKQRLQDDVDSSSKRIEKEKWEVEKLEERIRLADKRKHELEDEMREMKSKQKSLEEEVESVNKKRLEELEVKRQVETELKHLLKLEKQEQDDHTKLKDRLGEENVKLQKENIQLKTDIEKKNEELEKLKKSIEEKTESVQNLEKELQKQERTNKRNREEIENWKKERDSCVSKLEQLIRKGQQDNKQLSQEVEQLKKDNADLAKNVNNITNAKDSVIAELRKSNNTLSIQLAQVQGISPPPMMASPDTGYPNRLEFVEEEDKTSYVEVDATPPVALKKSRKRMNNVKQTVASSSVDPETHSGTPRKSLRPIEEKNEGEDSPRGSLCISPSRSPSKIPGKVAKLASDVLVGMSPLTRSAKKSEAEGKTKKKKTSIQAPFEPASYVVPDESQNENLQPYSTRRSSRLRNRNKHSVV